MQTHWLMAFLFIACPSIESLASAIHEAAQKGDVAAIQAALDGGASVNEKENRATPLFLAIREGHLDAVRLLLRARADPNQAAGFGYPLTTAIKMQRPDIVAILLQAGANPNIERQSVTALHMAADAGCYDCVRLLVDAGADVNARTSERSTPVHLAKRNGHQNVVDYLLSHGVRHTQSASILPLLKTSSVKRGMETFDQVCRSCHQVDPELPNPLGPVLWNVVGRKRATLGGFEYSSALREFGGDWEFESIGQFIADPVGVVPGTKMAFRGLDGDQNRADVVAYLRTLSDNPLPLP